MPASTLAITSPLYDDAGYAIAGLGGDELDHHVTPTREVAMKEPFSGTAFPRVRSLAD
jgi:hypothetical protein